MSKSTKGFTLIELLVVIAIIGILAGILFVAIDPKAQTDKADDASAKSELAQARTQAALVFSTEGDYATVCDGQVANLSDTCFDLPAAWAAESAVTDTDAATAGNQAGNWCVDSTGYTGASANSPTAASPICTN